MIIWIQQCNTSEFKWKFGSNIFYSIFYSFLVVHEIYILRSKINWHMMGNMLRSIAYERTCTKKIVIYVSIILLLSLRPHIKDTGKVRHRGAQDRHIAWWNIIDKSLSMSRTHNFWTCSLPPFLVVVVRTLVKAVTQLLRIET